MKKSNFSESQIVAILKEAERQIREAVIGCMVLNRTDWLRNVYYLSSINKIK